MSEELAMVPSGEQSADVWSPAGGSGGILYCSMPLGDDRASRIAVYNAVSGDAASIKDSVNETIEIEHVVVHSVELTDPTTGEITDNRRIVMLSPPDAKTGERKKVAAMSYGTEASMRKIVATVGNPPYDPPLRAKIKAVKTRSGFSAIVLELLG